MKREPIATDAAPAAIGPYSQAIRAGGFVFCSGQVALHPQSGELVGPDDVRAQTHRVMENLEAVLRAAGSGLDRIVKATIFVTDLGDFAAVNEVYGSYFRAVTPPARATIEVSALPKGARVEIEAVALSE